MSTRFELGFCSEIRVAHFILHHKVLQRQFQSTGNRLHDLVFTGMVNGETICLSSSGARRDAIRDTLCEVQLAIYAVI